MIADAASIWLQSQIPTDFQAAMQRMIGSEGGAEARTTLQPATPIRGGNPTRLPFLCCMASGGDPQQGRLLNEIWSLFYAAAHQLDAVQDDDAETNPANAGLSAPVRINSAVGLILTASSLLNRLEDFAVPSETARTLRAAFDQHLLRMCGGQHLDLTTTEPGLADWQQIAGLKSGEFFSLAGYSGAVLGNDPALCANLAEFGYNLGVLIQIGDDLIDFAGPAPDAAVVTMGRPSLPVAYAFEVSSPESARQLRSTLHAAAHDPDAGQAARAFVIECGGVVYALLEATRRQIRARSALNACQLPPQHHQTLIRLLEQTAPAASRPPAAPDDPSSSSPSCC